VGLSRTAESIAERISSSPDFFDDAGDFRCRGRRYMLHHSKNLLFSVTECASELRGSQCLGKAHEVNEVGILQQAIALKSRTAARHLALSLPSTIRRSLEMMSFQVSSCLFHLLDSLDARACSNGAYISVIRRRYRSPVPIG
jgi:hypothetical protein